MERNFETFLRNMRIKEWTISLMLNLSKINANYKVRTGRPEYPTVGKSNLLDFFSNIFTSPSVHYCPITFNILRKWSPWVRIVCMNIRINSDISSSNKWANRTTFLTVKIRKVKWILTNSPSSKSHQSSKWGRQIGTYKWFVVPYAIEWYMN